MAANTLGEFSDGEDDFVMEIDEQHRDGSGTTPKTMI